MFGVRTAVFVGLHERDHGRQRSVFKGIGDRRPVEAAFVEFELHVYRMGLAALVAYYVDIIFRHKTECTLIALDCRCQAWVFDLRSMVAI